MSKEKHPFGQYMTPSVITDFMVSLISKPFSCSVLEPSCGDGQFLLSLAKKGFSNITAYEIDSSITRKDFNIINSSFVSASTEHKYDVIIGNPPYIRWKNLEKNLKKELEESSLWNTYCNSLCDYSTIFIIKSIEQLNENGELIFITPEYWLSTTHAQKMRNYILSQGTITQIIHFNESHIFKNVSGSFIIFKFIKKWDKTQTIKITKVLNKNKITEKDIDNINSASNVDYFSLPQFPENSSWILADSITKNKIQYFEEKCTLPGNKNYESIGKYCSIGNGMVSGFDKAFNLEKKFDLNSLNENEKASTIQVVKAKYINQFFFEQQTSYIFINNDLAEIKTIEDFAKEFPHFATHLKPFLSKLKKRYDYHQELPFWKWAFLRNYHLFSSNQPKIFVPCKERITGKSNLRFCYADENLYPTQDVTAIYKKDDVKEDLLYILAYLNSYQVFNWLKYKGIRKGDILEFSERPISSIPFRKIDFTNEEEVFLHNQIVNTVKKYLQNNNKADKDQIQNLIEQLLNK